MNSKPHTATVLFLCRCGKNIADHIDLHAIAGWANRHEDVAAVETHDLLCSPAGRAFFKDKVEAHNSDSVVIAACSPKQHEKTFTRLGEDAGCNIGRILMTNIREQCAWVTKNDMDAATAKAKSFINAALWRTRFQDDLQRKSMPAVANVLVAGGGIAGIEAALTLSADGRKVYLLERDIALGGGAIKTEEIAPAMECSPCVLAPRLALVRDNPNIDVIANSEITAIKGFLGNYMVSVKRKARYVLETCIGCEACFESCPVSVVSEFHLGLGDRKAIHTLFPGSVPAAAAIDPIACRRLQDEECNACADACPFGAVDFDDADEDFDIEVGAIVVATGAAEFGLSDIERLGHGRIEDVYTLAEFDRLASSNGPTGGDITLRNGNAPASAAVIHCAGSLSADGLPYCSGTCCLEGVKAGALLRRALPDAAVYNIHTDLVFPGPAEFAFYKGQSASERAHFVRTGDPGSVRLSAVSSGIEIEGADIEPVTVDMVVLATGVVPGTGAAEIGAMCHADIGPGGFLKPGHNLLDTTSTSIDGLYVAGSARKPCGFAEAVNDGRAVAGDILSKLIPGREIVLETMTCIIDREKCGACKLCVSVCPYKAVSFDAEKNTAEINEGICRGCGTCSAACPTGAASARHFTDSQLFAEIGGILDV